MRPAPPRTARRCRGDRVSTLKVTQRRSRNGVRQAAARHAALARAAAHRPDGRAPGLASDPGHDREGPASGRGLRGWLTARADRAAQPEARSRVAAAAQARRPRRGLGHGQDLRPRPEGLGLALWRQATRPLRGWPEPDPHADAQAARPAHEEVDAVRAVPDPHPGRQPARPRGSLRVGSRGDARGDERTRAWRAARVSRSRCSPRARSPSRSPSTRTRSATAREKIEAAGGTCQVTRGGEAGSGGLTQ